METNKKKIILLFSCCFIIAFISFFTLKDEKQLKVTKTKNTSEVQHKKSQKPANDNQKPLPKHQVSKKAKDKKEDKSSRTPAAVPPQKTYVHIKTSNRYNKNWKKKALSNIKRNLNDKFKVEIKHKKQNVLRNGTEKKLIEEVLVTIEHESGIKSNYTALVDSETGAIIDTMQRTEFEKKDFYRPNIKLTNNSLELVPLNKDK
jgi:hypothetical protein